MLPGWLCRGLSSRSAPWPWSDSTEHELVPARRDRQTAFGGLLQLGNESMATAKGASLAVAFNVPGTKGSTANANGTGNFVVAGNNSSASVTGHFNLVRAINNSEADVTGNFNMGRAINNN